MNVAEIIKDIQTSLDIPWINNGGCVHFAYFLSSTLKRYGIKHSVIAINRKYYGITIKDIFNEGCSHLVVYIKGIGYIDAEKTEDKLSNFYSFDIVSDRVTDDIDLNKLRNTDVWRELYDRKKYDKVLESTISKKFKKIKYGRVY